MNSIASLFLGNPAWLRDTLQLAFLVGIAFEIGRNVPGLLWRVLSTIGRELARWMTK